jgi:prepilin signal peptidase PulO-like enzyme (type II secretory pathway)
VGVAVFIPSAGLPQTAVIILSALFGLSVGSFINVVVYRLPQILEHEWREADDDHVDAPASERISLSWPPSHCPACQTPLRVWENIPLLSFLMLRGRCRSCGVAIGWQYPVIEALCGLAFLVLALGSATGTSLVLAMALTAALLTLAAIDLRTLILPDVIVLPLLWLGLLANLHGRFAPLADAVIGATVGYMGLWIVSRFFRLIRKRDGMGDGDLKLLAALGAWLGWRMLVPIVLIAAVVAILATVIAVWSGRRSTADALPFGTALAVAGWVCLAHVVGLA